MELTKHIITAKSQYVKNGLCEHIFYSENQSCILPFKNNYLPDTGWTFDGIIQSKMTINAFAQIVESGKGQAFILDNSGSLGAGFWCRFDAKTQKFTLSSRFYAMDQKFTDFDNGTILNVTIVFDGSSFKEYSNGKVIGQCKQSDWVYSTVYNSISNGCRNVALGPNPDKYVDIISLRCYNRPLAQEEIIHNYKADKERFGV